MEGEGKDVKDMPVSGVVRTWGEGRRCVCSAVGRERGREGKGKRGRLLPP